MLRYVSPLVRLAPHEVINRTRSDAASWLRLGTRIGLGTASNDHQAFRLTGSLSLARSGLAGVGFHALFFIKSGLRLCLFKASPCAASPSGQWPTQSRSAPAPTRRPPPGISCGPRP